MKDSYENPPVLDFLLPTYNRAAVLEENLRLIFRSLKRIDALPLVRVVVSDNASTDDTIERVRAIQQELAGFQLSLYQNSENTGLKRNIFKTLELASAPHIMYGGDDDFLPTAYWRAVVEKITDDDVTFILPARQTFGPDDPLPENFSSNREATVDCYKRNWRSLWFLSSQCNQMSGLVYRLDSIRQRLTEFDDLDTLYPFMTFAGWCLLDGRGCHISEPPVMVTENVKKDWGYGGTGLLGDIITNARYITADIPFPRVLGELYLLYKWYGRIGMYWAAGKEEGKACTRALLKDPRLHPVTKLATAVGSQLLDWKIS